MKGFLALLLLFTASAAYGEIYTWKNAQGTAFYTNSLNEIPTRYQKKARVLDVATGKIGGLASEQPAPAATGQSAAQQTPAPNPAPPAPSAPRAEPVAAQPAPRSVPVPPAATPSPMSSPAVARPGVGLPQPQPPSMRQRRRVPRPPRESGEE